MKKAMVRCPYCGSAATLHPASFVFGKSARPGSLLYVCNRYPACDSYVGAHQKTKLPMGSLADGDLRHKRIDAHKAFDWIWKSGLMTKAQAYKWMQAKLGIRSEHAHIAKFGYYMCDQLISICNEARDCNRAIANKVGEQI